MRTRTRALLAAAIVAAVAVVDLVGYGLVHRREAPIRGVQTFGGLSQRHTDQPVAYPQTPPVGGPHALVWLNCGSYPDPVPAENAVHSMEHGAVWLTYRPDLPATQVAVLRDLVHRSSGHLLLSPYPGLPAPIVATAWGVQLRLDDATDLRLPQFVRRYRAGPQTPEKGGRCDGGVGTPAADAG